MHASAITSLVTSIEANQLASNHPIEDRLRVSSIKESKYHPPMLLLGVFDGHGGGNCSELVSQRLFNYIALALSSDPVGLVSETQPSKLITDIAFTPKPNSALIYEASASSAIQQHTQRNELYFLARFAEYLSRNASTLTTIESKLIAAFNQCDVDMAEEIEYNLSNVKSNLLKHFYLSLSLSGSCANVALVFENRIYVANCGDCRTILSIEDDNGNFKLVNMSIDHNSDNIEELKRIYSEHPETERNNIIRYNRLLGQLMPLRAFGDFGYKWPISKIKSVGLTKAYGPHVIPPFYLTPPYLTAKPEVISYDLTKREDLKFNMIMATDGLWEQFDTSHNVLETLLMYRHLSKSAEKREELSLEDEDYIDLSHLDASPSDANGNEAAPKDTIEREPLDPNRATYLLRSALSQTTIESEQYLDDNELTKFRHQRLVSFLTLSESVVRNFRDDISLIVVHF